MLILEPAELHLAVLADPHTAIGSLVLVNSLAENGFRGTIWLGIRGDRRNWYWVDAARRLGIDVNLVEFDPPGSFTYAKAAFIDHVFDDLAHTASYVIYLDTDLVVNRHWDFFRAWAA